MLEAKGAEAEIQKRQIFGDRDMDRQGDAETQILIDKKMEIQRKDEDETQTDKEMQREKE